MIAFIIGLSVGAILGALLMAIFQINRGVE